MFKLNRLELSGFKSFVDPVNLEVSGRLTAIVGPNGCGKSNIADAIRWVLGEQSAKALRGAKMGDVIFNGTDSHKPLGMAEVSLTLAECEEILETDYNEVTVTRRVLRSGEGQYFINRTPCRLKDIQRLFMDTGIGTSSYSLMEQGRAEPDAAKRQDIYASLNERFGSEAYNIWYNWSLWYIAMDTNVQGLLGPDLPDGSAPFPGIASGTPVSGLWISQ